MQKRVKIKQIYQGWRNSLPLQTSPTYKTGIIKSPKLVHCGRVPHHFERRHPEEIARLPGFSGRD